MRPLLALLSLILSTNVVAAEAPLSAEITIEPTVVKRGLDPHDYCSANWVWTTGTHALRKIFSTPDYRRDFMKFLHDDVHIRTIRYPAGGNVQYVHFGVPGSHFIDDMRKTDPSANPDDWIELDEFFKFLADGDLRTVFQVNTLSWYDDSADKLTSFIPPGTKLPMSADKIDRAGLVKAADRVEKMAQWIKENHYDRLIRIWEFGNEEYGGYSGEAYGVIAGELIRRVKKVLPDARIVVTNQLGVTRDEWKQIHNDFSLGVLKQLREEKLANAIDGVTNHVYGFAIVRPDGNIGTSTAYQEFAAYTSFLPDDPYRQPWEPLLNSKGERVSVIRKQADMLDASGYPRANIYMTEFRLGGMQEQYNQSLANGLGNLQLAAAYAAAPRVGGCTIHSLLHASAATHERPFQIWGYDVINFQMDEDLHPRFVSTPVSEAFNLLWRIAQGDVLRSSSSNPLLFTVATRDAHALRLLVINRAAKPESEKDVRPNTWSWGDSAEALAKESEKGDTFAATISLPAEFHVSGDVQALSLGESNKLSDRSVDPGTLNVHEVKVKATLLKDAIHGQQLRYTFPPHSATVLELSP
jgi:hypothetical protein